MALSGYTGFYRVYRGDYRGHIGVYTGSMLDLFFGGGFLIFMFTGSFFSS